MIALFAFTAILRTYVALLMQKGHTEYILRALFAIFGQN